VSRDCAQCASKPSRCITTRCRETGFRPLARSASLLKENIWRFSLQFHRRNLNGLDVKAFLGELLKHLRGAIILLWDRSPIHIKRKEVSEFLRQHPRILLRNSPLMLQNSIPPSISGIKRIGPYPIPRPKIWRNCKPCFLIRLLRLVTHKNFCGLASMPLTCHGG
jgi:hypothetical protein